MSQPTDVILYTKETFRFLEKILGRRFARARIEKKLSQKDVAAIAGISVTYLEKIETGGARHLRLPLILKICVALELPYPWTIPWISHESLEAYKKELKIPLTAPANR